MTPRAPWSLRHTLFAWLLGLTLALWGLSTFIVYLEADQESQELFDQSLAETSHLLLALADHEVQEHGSGMPFNMAIAGDPRHQQYLRYQIWDSAGRLLYKHGAPSDAAFAPAGSAGHVWVDLAGQRFRVYSSWNDSHRLQIQVAEPATHRKEISSRFAYKLSAFAVLMAGLAALAIWWSVNRAFRVLRQSTSEVASRTPNDLADVSLAGVPSEVSPLLLAINRLFGRVRRTMEHEQRFTADAAHELRTPLAAIKTNLQVIQRARNDAERQEFIGGLGVSVDRASRLVEQLLTLSRLDPQYQDAGGMAEHDLSAVLESKLALWRGQAGRRHLRLETVLEPARCRINREAILILAGNLIENALRYTPAGGAVSLACRATGDGIVLRVSDTGPGIPQAMRERVFERFFRLAGASQPGSGLGLSIVRRIADMHGATIELGSGPDGTGLAVTLTIPDTAPGAGRKAGASQPPG